VGNVDNIQMGYDGYGRRVSITERHGTTVLNAKTFVWCDGELCQERDVTGHTVNKQFFDSGEEIGTTKYYYTFDHLGGVREMTDAIGTVHARYDYDSWGRQTKLSGDLDADFGYAGYYNYKTTNQYLTLYRLYDPNMGRWLSRDPLGEFVGPNLYDYVSNDTMNWYDQLGLCPTTPPGGAPTSPKGNPDSGNGGLILPNDPSGLPQGWTQDPSHKAPNGQRFRNPQYPGKYLDYDKAQPGQPGWRGKPHWHTPDNPKAHLKPGTPVYNDPPQLPPVPWWQGPLDAIDGLIKYPMIIFPNNPPFCKTGST
jgi:RHS repeat-associated protein